MQQPPNLHKRRHQETGESTVSRTRSDTGNGLRGASDGLGEPQNDVSRELKHQELENVLGKPKQLWNDILKELRNHSPRPQTLWKHFSEWTNQAQLPCQWTLKPQGMSKENGMVMSGCASFVTLSTTTLEDIGLCMTVVEQVLPAKSLMWRIIAEPTSTGSRSSQSSAPNNVYGQQKH